MIDPSTGKLYFEEEENKEIQPLLPQTNNLI
jgi:hypothetical protein